LPKNNGRKRGTFLKFRGESEGNLGNEGGTEDLGWFPPAFLVKMVCASAILCLLEVRNKISFIENTIIN